MSEETISLQESVSSPQMESVEVPKQDASATLGESFDAPKLEASATLKTQGVKPARSGAIGVLQSAATKAARSNSRSDVHEYMRLRRSFV